MSRSKHTEAQMIAAVKQMEAGRKAEDVAREVGVSKHTIYAWKSKYGGMDVSEAQEAKRERAANALDISRCAERESTTWPFQSPTRDFGLQFVRRKSLN
jgi:putative transposase